MAFTHKVYHLHAARNILASTRIAGFALIGMTVCQMFNAPSMAQPVHALAHLANTAATTKEEPAWLMPYQRNRHSLNQIYEFDRTPLGDRIPVILVPGRAEEFQHNSWWRGLHRSCDRNPEFTKNFKVYVFLYDSKEELDVQAQALSQDIKRRFSQLPSSQPLMLVTYSLGGVISRETLQDPVILDQVDTMIAIAVPFHGSPMFDPDWFSEYLNPPNRSPVRRFWDRTVYRGYMFSKSNLTRGLKWDNFDSSKPQFDVEEKRRLSVIKKKGKSAQGKTILAGDQALSLVSPYTEYPHADEIRAKTIVYTSFMVNGYTKANQPFSPLKLPKYVLDNSLAFPKQIVATVLPFYGFTVHSVFTYMNNQMANIPTYTPEDPQGKNTHLYRYNDGAIPVSSMLFLKPSKEPYAQDIQGLVDQATVRKTRVFVNLDHLHVGEYTPFKKSLIKPDMEHPVEGKRSPNEWIILDLLSRLREIQKEQMVR
ncbi:MAG: PGAP1-like protein [Vampirovibrio sp.]|jgi:hypothetical protein|nr:PGAP1-like protein [Vampirovibrio sp.]